MAPAPHTPSHRKSRETRRRILDAARTAFAEKGFDGAHMRRIADDARVNKFMLYYHFRSKETLFQQVLQSSFEPLFRQLAKILTRDTPLDKTFADLYDMFAALFADRDGQLRSFMAREVAVGSPRLATMFHGLGTDALEPWRAKIETYMGTGHLPETQLRLAVYSIMNTFMATFLLRPALAAVTGADELFLYRREVREHVVDFVLGGLRLSVLAAH
ncbi:MAG: TetR/AcrR family transcriptional regulator [Candidatus Neomarinimicrobiota bacterium]